MAKSWYLIFQKFDAVTRYRIKDGGLSFFSDIALVLIDEVHLLNDPRGAALEAIVSRLKMISCNPELKSSALAHVRFLSVSATIPNIEDVGKVQFCDIDNHFIHVSFYSAVITLMFTYYTWTFAAEWLMVPVQGIKRYYGMQSLYKCSCSYDF